MPRERVAHYRGLQHFVHIRRVPGQNENANSRAIRAVAAHGKALPAVLAAEFINPASSINNLLFAGVERMAG